MVRSNNGTKTSILTGPRTENPLQGSNSPIYSVGHRQLNQSTAPPPTCSKLLKNSKL